MNVIFSPDLRSAFEHAGLPFPDCDPEAGRIVRFSTTGRNDDCAGWIRVFEDQNGAVFGDWRTGDNFVWQRGREGQPRDAADLAEIRAKADAARKAAEDEREGGYRQAARKALATWQAAVPAKDHAYLSAKGIGPHIARERNGWLVIPVFDQDGAIQSVQSISASGQKRFLPGAKMAGGRCWIGEPNESSPLLVAEGFATAATLHEVCGWPVCVAFNAGNLRAVALSLREQFPRAKLVICGDDDRHTQGNPGRAKAIEAAKLVRGIVVFPSFTSDKGSDFNDQMQQAGSEAVKRQILASVKEPTDSPDPFNWIGAFVLTAEEETMLTDAKWIYPNLIIQGHVIAIPARPNGGKTTLMTHIAGEIASKYRVIYVNADVAGSDAKPMLEHARKHGYTMLLPDMKAGMCMDDVVSQLERMNEASADYSETVFVFDTLKKMADMINKSSLKKVLATLRGLSAKGMTIVLLAHTNKYDGPDGKPVFEGTVDLRADVDELIYLIPMKNPDGTMTISTDPDKVRGSFQPITFTVTPDRQVIACNEYVNVAEMNRAATGLERDETLIEAITEAIRSGKAKQVDIAAYCKEHYRISRRQIERALIKYSRQPVVKWKRERGFENNAWVHELI